MTPPHGRLADREPVALRQKQQLGIETEPVCRLQFEDPMFAPPVDEIVSTNPFVLLPGSGWQHAVFPINPGAFTALTGSVTAALSQTTALRIIHSPSVSDATPVVGKLGIDNIQAVPEPSTLVLLAAGFALLAAKRLAR